jgi:hypothetical protein
MRTVVAAALLTVVHLAATLALLAYSYVTGMSRFDSGAPVGLPEQAANVALSVLTFPLVRPGLPGLDLPGHAPFALNGALWAGAILACFKVYRRYRVGNAGMAIVLAAMLACAGCGTHAVRTDRSGKLGGEHHIRKGAGTDAARASGRAFFFSAGGQGIDSIVASGLIGKTDGTIARFWYDSAPCGGPRCDERFEVRACPAPPATEPVDPVTFYREPAR